MQTIGNPGDSDHSALLAKVPLDIMMLLRPGPDVAALPIPSKLKTPVPAHQLAAFKEALAMETSKETAELNAELEFTLRRAHDIKAANPMNDNLKELLKTHDSLAELTEEMAKKLQDIMSKVVPIAQKTRDYTDPQLGHKRHMPRAMSRKMKAELNYRRILNAAMQQYVANKCSNDESWQAPMREQGENSMQTLDEQLRVAFPSIPKDTNACAGTDAVNNNNKRRSRLHRE